MSDITRITGMVTGLDTDELVEKLVSLEQTRIDRIKQDKQYTEWTQDAYREIINLFKDFKDEYFNFLNSESNMRSASSLNSYQVTYNGNESSDYLNITAAGESTFADYPITKITTASRAESTGAVLAGSVEGISISAPVISSSNDNNKISITLNGIREEITIADGLTGFGEIRDNLQTGINTVFGVKADGSAKITVSLNSTGDGFVFSTEKTNNLSLDYAYNDGFELLINKNLSEGLTLDDQSNKFTLTLTDSTAGTETIETVALTTGSYADAHQLVSETQSQVDSIYGADVVRVLNVNDRMVFKAVGGAGSAVGSLAGAAVVEPVTIDSSNNSLEVTIEGSTETLTLDEGSYTRTELLTEIQGRLNAAFGVDRAMVSLDSSNMLRFEGVGDEKSISAAQKENGGLEALGLVNIDELTGVDTVNKSNKIKLNTSLAEISEHFNTPFSGSDTDGDGYDIEFTINGQSFAFDSAVSSLDDIMDEVNSSDEAGVVIKYDELNDYLTVETKETGVTTTLSIDDTAGEGNLMEVLGLNGTAAAGRDAVVTFGDGSAEGLTITRPTNTFTVDGLSFELKEDFFYEPGVEGSASEPIEMSIETDTTATLELLKGFVEKYNEVVSKVNEALTEKRFRDYPPLTETQKEEMSEEEIELWEEKAKSGILKSDPILQNMLYSMRSALYQEVEGAGINLFDLGIETSRDYLDGGKLTIDEEKLRAALREKPEEVMELFTASGDTFETKGLSARLYDIIQENIRTTRSESGLKGMLLEKAGIEGDISEFNNILTDRMDDYDDRIDELLDDMAEKEEHYYNMFARMEAAISRMNNQSAWLLSQLGMGGGTMSG